MSQGPKVNLSQEELKKLFTPTRKRRPVYKKPKCTAMRGKSIHRFLNEKPFDWQKCMCKRFTFGQLEELSRQGAVA